MTVDIVLTPLSIITYQVLRSSGICTGKETTMKITNLRAHHIRSPGHIRWFQQYSQTKDNRE